ncbi:MAG: hypothetical protein MUO54_09820 [Anaerolineales bacterium]|nr:hypothetical protein [Anaerolineales bacterium]
MKKRIKLISLAVAMVVLIGSLTQVDYSDLSWTNNAGMYLTIIAMLLLIFGTVYSLFFENEKRE